MAFAFVRTGKTDGAVTYNLAYYLKEEIAYLYRFKKSFHGGQTNTTCKANARKKMLYKNKVDNTKLSIFFFILK